VTPAPFLLQDSAGPSQIVCDLPMTRRGPAEEAVPDVGVGQLALGQKEGSKNCLKANNKD
jgi:hypothetical protein